MELIPPGLRARLKTLRLRTRLSPVGQGLGQHASRSRGAGLEFSQYRAYEPGDEPRRIDWKLYARSDRFFVRDAERDSPLTVWLLLDTTASMRQADRARPDYAKLDAARTLAAAVAELALQQGDAFACAALGGEALRVLPPGGGARHRDRLHLQLRALQAGGRWPDETPLRPLWERIAPAALVVALGDGFDEAGTVLLERLAGAGREVALIQILTADERDFPFEGGYVFRDPETGEERRVDAAAARSDFLQRFGAARAALARRLAGAGIRHVEHLLDEPPERPLQRLFAPSARPGASR